MTELRWLDIKPTEADLRIKYVLEGGVRRPDTLVVSFDDRWKLLTNDKLAIIEQGKATVPGQHLIRVPVSSQSADRQEILLQFQLRKPPELGSLRLPPVELMSVSANKRWVAISADSSLDCEIIDSTAVDGTVNEFFAKWGDATDEFTPQSVLSNVEPNRPLTLAIRPRKTEPVVDESLSISAGLGTVRRQLRSKSHAAQRRRL